MFNEESKIELPNAPTHLKDRPVIAWSQPVNIDTYDALPPSPYPAYLDRRVYQGSSGRVYPMPFYERIADEKRPQVWEAIHLENEYVRLMIIPSLGGRIHHGTDKTTGYDFFYKNNVMKPALVGVLGPWISGGVEFNWPQHHRPATYLPTDWEIEEHDDGAVTVWCSDHDPFARMKGMHGITLRPGSAVIELRAKLTNRTDDVQTFLWWSNVAAEVHDDYQAFFPTDMRVVADHAKRAITGFPNATIPYYGIDYPSRVDDDHPDADRLDWYRNIPVPTSYMCLGTEDDFFGGYDHKEEAGFVYWADKNVAPGKKMWTWGNSDFGHAWDKNLTDTEGPYIELMAGAYTDNQPDFSFLFPGETKTFSQYWYPIQQVGVIHQANLDAAVHLDWDENESSNIKLGIAVTKPFQAVDVTIKNGTETIWATTADLKPGGPLNETIGVPEETVLSDLEVTVECSGTALISWTPRVEQDVVLPPLAEPAPMPKDIDTNEELYLAGSHLEQYRHPTRGIDQYFLEALKRDPHDVRSGVALATRMWRRGQFEEANAVLMKALERVTFRNPNPYDSEIYYRLGLVRRDLGDDQGALDAFHKATWDPKWLVGGSIQAARIELRLNQDKNALADAQKALTADCHNQQAAALVSIAKRRLGQEWGAELETIRSEDLLNWWSADLLGRAIDSDAQTILDVALEYLSVGEYGDGERLLKAAILREKDNQVVGEPTITALAHYYLAFAAASQGMDSVPELQAARESDLLWAFPGRLDDAKVLEWAKKQDDKDAVARRLLGHWLYGHDRHQDAMDAWNEAVNIQDEDPVTRRNLGIAAVNLARDWDLAVAHYERALQLSPNDPKLWQERDQLAYLMGESADKRLDRLDKIKNLILERDDLTIAFVELLTIEGRADKALEIMREHLFHPWEGGEGKALKAWENANLAMAFQHLENREKLEAAHNHAVSAIDSPENLGEARHPLANTAQLHFVLGEVYEAIGQPERAISEWEIAIAQTGDFLDMSVSEYSIKSIYQAKALRKLGRTEEADDLLNKIIDYANQLAITPGSIEYFATSLPTMLLFHTDLDQDNQIEAAKLKAWASHLLGKSAKDELTFLEQVRPSDPEVASVIREICG